MLEKTVVVCALRKALLMFFLSLLITSTSWSVEFNSESTVYPLFKYSQLLEVPLVSESNLNDSGQLAFQEYKKGKFSESRALINHSLNEVINNNNADLQVNTLILNAVISFKNGYSLQALQSLHRAYKINNQNNNIIFDQSILMIIGGIHQARKEHTLALEYLDAAIGRIAERPATKRLALTEMLRISSLISAKNTEKAGTILLNLKSIIETSKIDNIYSYYHQFKGELDFQNDRVTESIDSFNTAIKVSDPKNFTQLANLHLLMSKSLSHTGNLERAIDELVKAFSYAGESAPSLYFYQTLQLHRAYLLRQMDEFEAAFNISKDLYDENEEIESIEDLQVMLNMHGNFRLNAQVQENILLRENNRMQALQLENKKTLNRFYFVVMALLVFLSVLLLLLFLKTKKHQRALEKIAHTDSLTKLNSRARVLELLEHHNNLFNRDNATFSVAIVDLDYFKKINDEFGHVTGDQVLTEFGNMCRRTLRKTDIIGRIGGEEFLIVFPNTSLDNALDVCNLLNRKLPDIGLSLSLSIKTTASIGLASPLKNEKGMEVVKRADEALYEAKSEGRNQVVVKNNIASVSNNYKTVV